MRKIKRIGILLITLIILSCKDDSVKLVIKDFSEKKEITYKPYKLWPYAILRIKVKGYVNDTIKIEQGYPSHDILLVGQLDTIREMEYYGEGPRTFILNPYKATEGELEIEIGL